MIEATCCLSSIRRLRVGDAMTEEVIVMATARSEKESLESILEREVDVRKTRWKVGNGLIEKMSGN